MKQVYKIVFSILPAYMLYGFCSLHGQPVIISGKLNGETVTSTITPEAIGSSNESFVVTPTTVYEDDEMYGFLFPIPITSYEKVFTAPPGRTIKATGTKADFLYGKKYMAAYIMILLDNGDVYYINRFTGMQVVSYGHIATTGTAWQKILGEAVYALSSTALYVTRDNGATWQPDTTALNGAHMNDFDQDSSLAKLYAATTKGLFKKDTLPGSVWNVVSSFTGTVNVSKVFIDKRNRILVAGSGGGLWISRNNGSTWTVDTAGLGANGTLNVFGDDVYGNLYGANNSSGKLYRSLNGNHSWQLIDAGILKKTVHVPLYRAISGDSLLAVATNFGNFVTGDQGSTWFKADTGIITENIYSLAKLSNNKIFTGTAFGLFSKNAGDTVWNKSYPVKGYSTGVLVYNDNSDNLFVLDNAITHNSNTATPILKSTNQGSTWSIDTAGLSKINTGTFYIDETGAQHIGSSLYGSIFVNQMWKRSPGGSWTMDTVGFPVTNLSFVSSIASDGNGFVYVSGLLSSKKVMRRPVAGGAWVTDTAGIASSVNYFTKMVPGHKGDVLGVSGNFLFRRHNNTWISLSLPLSQIVTAAAADSAGNIFAAFADNTNLGYGLWYTKDNGTTWTKSGLDSIYIKQLIAYNDTVYALTSTRGAYAATATSCAKPKKLLAQNITATTADVSWNAVAGAAKYKLQYKASTATKFTSVTTTNISFHLTGLSANTIYNWKVQTYCTPDGSSKSPFAQSSFTTASSLMSPITSANNEVRIIPNPTNGTFTIQLNSVFNEETTINITDEFGKNILSAEKNPVKALNEFPVDISKFANGIYFVEVIQGNRKLVQKLVKE